MIYFITEERLKDITPVLDNVDYKLVHPLVKSNSFMWLQPILGTHFMEYLLAGYNGQSLTPKEEKLLVKVQNALAWRVCSDVVFTTQAQISNKGIQTQNGMNSEPASVQRLGMLTKHYNAKAEHFESELISFLGLNKEDYPEYTSKDNNDCTQFYKPKKEGYNDTGVHFF